jgi:hypothetical protein
VWEIPDLRSPLRPPSLGSTGSLALWNWPRALPVVQQSSTASSNPALALPLYRPWHAPIASRGAVVSPLTPSPRPGQESHLATLTCNLLATNGTTSFRSCQNISDLHAPAAHVDATRARSRAVPAITGLPLNFRLPSGFSPSTPPLAHTHSLSHSCPSPQSPSVNVLFPKPRCLPEFAYCCCLSLPNRPAARP